MSSEAVFRVETGAPYPLGASWDGKGVNFALFSAHAEKVELCLFDRKGRKEIARIQLPEHTDQVWHGYLPEARPGLLYGYRVYGPYEPSEGHRFNPHKLLIDPYAKRLHGHIRWTDAHYGYIAQSNRKDLSYDRRDNAFAMPKCVVVDNAFTWGSDRRVLTPWSETIIYETHVRGFTQKFPDLPKNIRGSFSAMSHHKVIDYLKSLGVTTVELLPVHHFADDRFLVDKGLRNYWGYSTLAFFAPEQRYLSGAAGIYDFKTMVMRLHDAGIEVILDVVYNHTAEGNEQGPTLSFRGIDNASYYRLNPDNKRYYLDETGCGHTLNLTHPRVLQMVMDSLRYWVNEMHVDGFRFDLASSLGREVHGFDAGSGFFDAIRQDPVLSRVKLIAEPWDLGPGGYQLGGFPSGWAEWNDRSRDAIRKYWRGDEHMLPELAKRLHGSGDKFEHADRRPWASVNFVCSHDGFCLNDLVSYNQKHNHANGEDNRDGHSHDYAYNHGVEGPTEDPDIMEIRERQRRNMIATVLLAQGTPMILAGDEFGRTQGGNNNPYCQDNEISWLRWDDITAADRDFRDFVRRMIKLRKRHPVLRRGHYLHGARRSQVSGFPDLEWYNPEGRPMAPEHWQSDTSRALGLLLAGDVPTTRKLRDDEQSETLFIVFNAHTHQITFRTPESKLHRTWRCIVDTFRPKRPSGSMIVAGGATFTAEERSLYVFILDHPYSYHRTA